MTLQFFTREFSQGVSTLSRKHTRFSEQKVYRFLMDFHESERILAKGVREFWE